MSANLELPDDLAASLARGGQRVGMSMQDYAVYILASAKPLGVPLRTGADLVAYWEAEGLLSGYPGALDSPEEARRLRKEIQQPR